MQPSGRVAERTSRSTGLVAILFLAVVTNLLGIGCLAYGQQPFSTGGWSGNPNVQPFDPELFADYLLSDQTPHPAVARIIAPES